MNEFKIKVFRSFDYSKSIDPWSQFFFYKQNRDPSPSNREREECDKCEAEKRPVNHIISAQTWNLPNAEEMEERFKALWLEMYRDELSKGRKLKFTEESEYGRLVAKWRMENRSGPGSCSPDQDIVWAVNSAPSPCSKPSDWEVNKNYLFIKGFLKTIKIWYRSIRYS